MVHFLVFTLLLIAIFIFIVWIFLLAIPKSGEYVYIVWIIASGILFIGIAGYCFMLPPPSPTTVRVTADTFKPSNINSASVRFVNNTSQSLVLCLAEHWQCNAHPSGWCQPSYRFPGWISDWFPRAFMDCAAVRYVKLYAHQQVVMNFDTSDQAYEIMVQGHQAMRLVLKNPPSSGGDGGSSASGGGDNGGGGGSGGDGGSSVSGGGSSVSGEEDEDDDGGGGSGGGGGDDGGDD